MKTTPEEPSTMHFPLTSVVRLGVTLAVLAGSGRAQNALVNWENPPVHPLDMTGDQTRLLAVNLPDGRLEVFELSSGTPVWSASIPVGLDPVSVRAAAGNRAWVVNHVSDSVSVVDLDARRVVATLATDDEPTDVVLANGRAFVSCSQTNTVLVFQADDLMAAPVRLAIAAEEPRAMAVSPDGSRVYVAAFESGNRTTVLGNGGFLPGDFPSNVVGFALGPHGGQNPPPNDGPSFDPLIAPDLPEPPGFALIVRQDEQGRWMDDNDGNWSPFVSGSRSRLSGRVPGWSMLDHDVVRIDSDTLEVSYVDGMMNLCMALAVDPATGAVTVVGTDAINEVRFEPNVAGRFLRVLVSSAAPGAATPAFTRDLNPHLDYQEATVPQEQRDLTLSDPRGIVWNGDGSRAYVTGMDTDNVVVLDASGQRAGTNPTIEVGHGPTGIVLDEARQRLYVLNRFDATISVVSTASELEVGRVGFFDPTPAAIKKGRPFLYDAHRTSGLGLTSCASCHVDARTDRLAWDLGDPQGQMQGLDGINRAANIPGDNHDFVDFHPMKGPMLTQTLQDIIGHEPFHWRGDRLGLEAFNPAFRSLLGDDTELTDDEMQALEDFLATIAFPPNPNRNLDNSLSTSVPLTGLHTPGRFAEAGLDMPNGNAVIGKQLFKTPVRFGCNNCHTLPTGLGADYTWNGSEFERLAPGPHGEQHHAVFHQLFQVKHNIKIASLRNLYERVGFDGTVAGNTAGFGYRHDGTIDSLTRFVARPNFQPQSDQEIADIVAFLLSLSGEELEPQPLDDPTQPPGEAGLWTHAAVGKQVTLAGAGTTQPGDLVRLAGLVQEAQKGRIGLVVRGGPAGTPRGGYFVGNGTFQADRVAERFSLMSLIQSAAPGAEVTFTAVPKGSERRIGVDRDRDGLLDQDELDVGSDPADPLMHRRRL